ncbi:putative oxidoreductase [Parelusimicrobium proximum]|uniref:aldo/keto reductase n=1 Tax=Parelusimicrobium proximum TaxID=3228953 RepID=UPI003D16A61D
MEYKSFARVDEKLSAIALGTWAVGGSNWGKDVDDKNSLSAIRTAIDKGINIIDTAPFYGFGHSEEIVGEAVKNAGDNVLIATKCGLVNNASNRIEKLLSRSSIKTEIDLSLRRLNLDYIDIYQTHWPDPSTTIEETYETLNELKAEGKIRYIGACNVDIDLLRKIDVVSKLSFVQNEFSYFDRDMGEQVFKYCEENGIALLGYGPLAGGILSGKYKSAPNFERSDARSFMYSFYKGDAFKAANEAVDRFRKIALKYNCPVSAVALNWSRAQSPCLVPLVGAKRPGQVEQNTAFSSFELTPEDIEFLNAKQ